MPRNVAGFAPFLLLGDPGTRSSFLATDTPGARALPCYFGEAVGSWRAAAPRPRAAHRPRSGGVLHPRPGPGVRLRRGRWASGRCPHPRSAQPRRARRKKRNPHPDRFVFNLFFPDFCAKVFCGLFGGKPLQNSHFHIILAIFLKKTSPPRPRAGLCPPSSTQTTPQSDVIFLDMLLVYEYGNLCVEINCFPKKKCHKNGQKGESHIKWQKDDQEGC